MLRKELQNQGVLESNNYTFLHIDNSEISKVNESSLRIYPCLFLQNAKYTISVRIAQKKFSVIAEPDKNCGVITNIELSTPLIELRAELKKNLDIEYFKFITTDNDPVALKQENDFNVNDIIRARPNGTYFFHIRF